ncbi:MAG: hypothetical protein N2594_02680 [Clostridiales bacterium]|nr:hypothetical protein [Clostridiales bacterium]
MQNTYLNLKGIMFNGNILDICNKGNSIINEIVSEQNENIEKNMLNLEDFQKTNEIYDVCIFFFTISNNMTKLRLNNIIKKIKSNFTKGTNIYIWDIAAPKKTIYKEYKISVDTDYGLRLQHIKVFFNPFRISFLDILKVLENNNFKIHSSILNSNLMYIQAEYNGEEEINKYESNISSFKRKIRSFKFSNKIFKKRTRRRV